MAHAITLHVTDDTFIQKESPNIQSGSVASLQVDNRNLTKEHITYALFDLSLVPSDAVLDKAVLRFFVNKVTQAGTLQILVVTQPWTEKTLTWNTTTAPASAADPAVKTSIVQADADSYVTIDITHVVQQWVNNPQTNLGLALQGESPALNIALDSKESTSTSHPMELEVVLESGTCRNTGTPGARGAARGGRARRTRRWVTRGNWRDWAAGTQGPTGCGARAAGAARAPRTHGYSWGAWGRWPTGAARSPRAQR